MTFRNRRYLLSRVAAVLVASFGGLLAAGSVAFYLFGAYFAGPLYAALFKAQAGRIGLALCLGLFLLLFGLLARAAFHVAQAQFAQR